MSKIKKADKVIGNPPSEASKDGKKAQPNTSNRNGKSKIKGAKGPERTKQFKGYNLEELPLDALPHADVEYKGKHSYTVCIKTADAWINAMRP